MKLYLARHGETDLNIDDRYQGRSDAALNERGLAQAQALAQALPHDITRIVASPMRRAVQTAQAVAHARGLPVHTMEGLREKDFGCFDGLTPGEVSTQYPDLWQSGVLTSWDQLIPGGETTRAVVDRVTACLIELQQKCAQDIVLLVVHGFVIRALRYRLDGLRESDFFTAARIGNAEFLVRAL